MDYENKKINTPIQDMVNRATSDSTIGPMIGSVIIIVVIIVGGLYFFGSIISYKKEQIKTEQNLQAKEKIIQIEETAKQSSSDDVSSIETDILSTDIDTIDEGL